MPAERIVRAVDGRLAEEYGSRDGLRGVGEPLDGLVLTILSQNTSDVNSDRAFARLKQALPTWAEVLEADTAVIEEAIRPGGISNIKAERIQRVLEMVRERLGRLDLGELGSWETGRILDFLLSLPGVGRKTASVVLTFYFSRPVFPVDTHVYRVTRRLGWVPPRAGLEQAHIILDAAVPDELKGRLHLNLISHGRAVCAPRKPRCGACVIEGWCDKAGLGEGEAGSAR